MARLRFAPEEAINVLMANDLLPEVIRGVKIKDDTLIVKVATPLPLVDSLPVSIKYVGFEDGVVTLELSVGYLKGRVLDSILKLVKGRMEEEFGDKIQLDYPRVYVHINRLLVAKNIRSVEVREITFEGGLFEIMVVVA
jgi:hypothetical protein